MKQTFSDESIESSVAYLQETAMEIGQARARMTKARHMIDHVESLLMAHGSSMGSDIRARAKARADERYLEAIEEHADAVGAFETLKSMREAHSMRLGAWQTESANYRGIKV